MKFRPWVPALFAILLFSLSSHDVHAERVALPPAGSWEAWILRLRRPDLSKFLSGARPDKKKISDPLPIWVDCHLSWVVDHPQLSKTLRLPKGVTLHSTPKKCRGQIEEWAR